MNQILKSALSEIAMSRREALQNAKLEEEALRENEEYSALERELAITGISLAKKRSEGKDASVEQTRYDELVKEKAELLARLGYPDGVKPDFSCPKCEDTGVYRGAQCSCVKKKMNELIQRKLRSSNVPSFRFKDFKEEVIESATQKKKLTTLYKQLKNMCEKFPETKHLNLVISGSTGVGKTCALSATANELLSRGFSVLFLSAFELGSRFLSYHTSPLSERSIYLADLMSTDVLVIDDLGSEPMLKNVTAEYLLCVISERTARGRHTFISTNLSANDILSRYGERIFSRLFDKKHSSAVLLEGSDLRLV